MPEIAGMAGPASSRQTGRGHWAYSFRDNLGRPLAGTVTVTGTVWAQTEGQLVAPAPVPVVLERGSASVHLPAGTYTVTGSLRTAEGARVTIPPMEIVVV